MIRLKRIPPMPDAVNCEFESGYTQVPNEVLRHPGLTAKAKVVLFLALSNKEGWTSFVISVSHLMKESEDNVRSAVKELEKFGYLIRFKYRDKVFKEWKGWLWVYTNIPHRFNLKKSLDLLNQRGLEIPNLEKKIPAQNGVFPFSEEPNMGNLPTNNTNINNTNNKNFVEDGGLKKASNGYITPKDFFEFWAGYPSNRRGSQGDALTAWEKLCHDKEHRPTKNRIMRALIRQKDSERWSKGDPQFIPLASTWINKKRWLDDPSQMVIYKREKDNEPQPQQESSDLEWQRQFGYDKD